MKTSSKAYSVVFNLFDLLALPSDSALELAIVLVLESAGTPVSPITTSDARRDPASVAFSFSVTLSAESGPAVVLDSPPGRFTSSSSTLSVSVGVDVDVDADTVSIPATERSRALLPVTFAGPLPLDAVADADVVEGAGLATGGTSWTSPSPNSETSPSSRVSAKLELEAATAEALGLELVIDAIRGMAGLE